MRRFVLIAATLAAACTPPSQTTTTATTADTTTPVATACNGVVPDLSKPVRLGPPPVAVAALPDLAGGPLRPGTYDLTSGSVADGAPAWTTDHFVALAVAEDENGTVLNWASSAPGMETERWTASFHQGTPSTLAFTCGRDGNANVQGAATDTSLTLRLPDASGHGADVLMFTKRG